MPDLQEKLNELEDKLDRLSESVGIDVEKRPKTSRPKRSAKVVLDEAIVKASAARSGIRKRKNSKRLVKSLTIAIDRMLDVSNKLEF